MIALFRLLFVVPLAYAAAVLAAATTVALGAVGLSDVAPPGFFLAAFVVNLFAIGAVAFIPAGIGILAAEFAAIRSPYYYLAAGAGLGFAADRLAFYIGRADLYDQRAFLYVAAGCVGAAIYWLLAGMNAGAGITLAEPEA